MDATLTVTQDDMIRRIHAATEEVFNTMLGLQIETGEPRQGDDEPNHFDGVVSLVGIGGSWTGSGRIYCGPKFACELAGALLASEYTAVDEDVLDAIAEITNMIIGNVKTSFEEKLGPLGLGVPTVIFGRNYQARSNAHDWTVVPFHSGGETMEIRFCLMPSPPERHHHHPHRSDPVPA